MEATWRLEFFDTRGGKITVWGSEAVLRIAYKEWLDFVELPDGVTGAKIITVEGITDTSDRAESSTSILAEQITSAILVRLY